MNKILRKFRANCTSGGGFTLAELLIVVAVIAVLVAVAIPTFTNQLEKSRQAVDVSNLRGAYAAARLAEIDQAVGTERFKTVMEKVKSTDSSGYVSGLQYWYDPDSGELTRLVDPDADAEPKIIGVSSGGVISGKATGNKVVADTSQLPSIGDKIVYNRGSLNMGTRGTVDKGILVAYRSDTEKNDVYVIDKIVFVTSSGVWGADEQDTTLYRATDLPGTLTIKTISLSDTGSETTWQANASGGEEKTANITLTPTDITGGTAPYLISNVTGSVTGGIQFAMNTEKDANGNEQIQATLPAGLEEGTYKGTALVTDSLGTTGTVYFSVKTTRAS